MNILAPLRIDGYKVGHPFQYPTGTQGVYSNFTPRKARVPVTGGGVVAFGLQGFIREVLLEEWNRTFFDPSKDVVLRKVKRRLDGYLGPNAVTIDHFADLHDLGYLPLEIKGLPEGAVVPHGVPVFTVRETRRDQYWLVNSVETDLSSYLWPMITSATTAHEYRLRFDKYSKRTVGNTDFVPFQGHDFSYRGMCGTEAAARSGAGHLLSFCGTDTLPAIDYLEQYYDADADKEMVGVSVNATEHSVMCMGSKEGEFETYRRLIQDVYPEGIVSIVSDTWDYWGVLTKTLPALKNLIMSRNGKVVIRPDSGDPVKIILGDPNAATEPERLGSIRVLAQVFGTTTNSLGYKTLDPHIGLIYGDSITQDRQQQILAGLEQMGYAADNIVLGIGSYTYQYVTRDTHGFAMKATAGIDKYGNLVSIYKDPKTDDGTKKSARGLLRVDKVNGVYVLTDNCTPEQESGGELTRVFRDGKLYNRTSMAAIRKRLADYREAYEG